MSPITRCRMAPYWAYFFIVATNLLSASPAMENGSQETWPFQDGSLVVTQTGEGTFFSFPYVPFLGIPPAWTPAYPREYQQPVEPVLPLPGLKGKVTFSLQGANGSNRLQVLSRTPYSAKTTIHNGSEEIHLSWVCPLGEPGVVFECANPQPKEATLEIGLICFGGKTMWATPGKKMKHDWGVSSWEWKAGDRYLLQSSGNPIDVTHSLLTALWIGESTSESKGPAPIYLASDPQHLRLLIPLQAGSSTHFGFVHADNGEALAGSLARVRKATASPAHFIEAWKGWFADTSQKIQKKNGISLESLTPEQRRIIENNLQITRQLFLSNGSVLTEPMTPRSYSLSIADQGVALNHWHGLGLEYPFLDEQAELVRYNRIHQRSVDIPVFQKDGVNQLFKQGRLIVAAPDPSLPPDKTSFDTVLGSVISGGHLTLVDGVEGFRGKEGWWKEAGAADLADYAIQMLGVPVDPASRRTLDAEGLAPTVNTFLAKATSLSQGTSPTPQTVTVLPPKPGGYVLLCPSSEEGAGVRILSGRIGGESFRPFTIEEDHHLAGGFAPRVAYGEFGETVGCDLQGEAFRAYKIPTAPTGLVEFSLSGGWNVAWSESLPQTHLVLRKKAFQSWFSRELMQVPILRLCHPVVYSGTYTCRVFDVSGTEESPFLFTKVGRGTFVWLGLPRDYLLLGSDTGSDFQNSLRNDPTYDLVRLTFAFHDPKRAGADRSSRTPLSGWGEGWSQSMTGIPDPYHAFFAWRPVEASGWATQPMNGWVEETFTNTLEIPKSDGYTVLHHPLITRGIGENRRILELPDNAFIHAVYKRMERASKVTGRVWLEEDSHHKAGVIAKNLPVLLAGSGEDAAYARAIADGTPGAAIPTSALLPRAAWAATEISPADFPGGATGQTRLFLTIANDPETTKNTQAMAVLAVQDGNQREQFLERLLAHYTDPRLGLIGREGKQFDLATAVPTVRALVLSARK